MGCKKLNEMRESKTFYSAYDIEKRVQVVIDFREDEKLYSLHWGNNKLTRVAYNFDDFYDLSWLKRHLDYYKQNYLN